MELDGGATLYRGPRAQSAHGIMDSLECACVWSLENVQSVIKKLRFSNDQIIPPAPGQMPKRKQYAKVRFVLLASSMVTGEAPSMLISVVSHISSWRHGWCQTVDCTLVTGRPCVRTTVNAVDSKSQ